MKDLWRILNMAREHITENYAAALTDRDKLSQLRAYIEKFLRDGGHRVDGLTPEELAGRLYNEMAQYSVLTPYLGSPDYEEINVNAWNDIALTRLDGTIIKLEEHFHSPQHAIDIVKRLLHHSGMIIDNSLPLAQGHLPNNTRIAAIKEPIVDKERGIAVSIRMLHSQKFTREMLLESGTATGEMIDFLSACIRYGVPFVVVGSTSSGKTTFLNYLMTTILDNKRIFTIESGAREFSLVNEEGGKIINNVVHTLSRPSDNPAYDISQEKLVVYALRFNPDVIAIGEIRDIEAHSAVEASLTGHTIVSSVHAGDCRQAHLRIALLCQKRFPIDFNTSLIQATQAFPIVVFCHKLDDNSRKVMEIAEAEILPNGDRVYHTLYDYQITKNTACGDGVQIEGQFRKQSNMSESLRRRLMLYGIPQPTLQRFISG